MHFLKTLIILLATLSLVQHGAATDETKESPEPVVINDPKTVFTKAFWRRPQNSDRIIKAERREWFDTSENLIKWQWFLVVEPSQPTRDWLATNPFFLSPSIHASSKLANANAPEWFESSESLKSKYQNASGSLSVTYSQDGKRLYATDSGSGFATGN